MVKLLLFYSAGGEYTAKVTAFNACVNETVVLSYTIYVQTPPEDLSLDRVNYVTRLGNATTFQASLTAGVFVHFDWNLGDNTPDHLDAGRHLIFVM